MRKLVLVLVWVLIIASVCYAAADPTEIESYAFTATVVGKRQDPLGLFPIISFNDGDEYGDVVIPWARYIEYSCGDSIEIEAYEMEYFGGEFNNTVYALA